METGKIPKRTRANNDNKLNDTDDDEEIQQQQPSSQKVINKRRRKIFDDEDDDSDAIAGSSLGHSNSDPIPTTGRSTRSTRTSSSTTTAASDRQVDVSVSDPSSARRRSTRSSQALQHHTPELPVGDMSNISKKSATMNDGTIGTEGTTSRTAYDVDDEDDDGHVDLSKIPRKNLSTSTNASTTIDRGTSLPNDKASFIAAPPTKSPIRNSRDQHQQQQYSRNGSIPVKSESDNAARSMNERSRVDSSNELTKEEKLRKFLAAQQQIKTIEQQRGKASENESSSNVTNVKNIALVQQRQSCESLVMQDLRQICDQFSNRSSRENSNKKVQLDIQLSSKGRVDLFGSFICTDDDDTRQLDDRYDFFDINDNGDIIISTPQPIFPDEFPDRQPTHNAAWWGIVEPTLGVGKYKSLHQQPKQAPYASTGHNAAAKAKNGSAINYRGADNNTNRGRNNDSKFGNRGDRSSSHIVENRQYNYDRIPSNNDKSYLERRDEQKGNSATNNTRNSHDLSSSRNHGRR